MYRRISFFRIFATIVLCTSNVFCMNSEDRKSLTDLPDEVLMIIIDFVPINYQKGIKYSCKELGRLTPTVLKITEKRLSDWETILDWLKSFITPTLFATFYKKLKSKKENHLRFFVKVENNCNQTDLKKIAQCLNFLDEKIMGIEIFDSSRALSYPPDSTEKKNDFLQLFGQKKLANLKTFILHAGSSGIIIDCFDELLKSHKTNLNTIELHVNGGLHFNNLENLFKYQKLEYIQRLELVDLGIDDSTLRYMTVDSTNLPSVTFLSLRNNFISDAGMGLIAMSNLHSLKKLDVGGNEAGQNPFRGGITIVGIILLLNKSRTVKKLKSVALDYFPRQLAELESIKKDALSHGIKIEANIG